MIKFLLIVIGLPLSGILIWKFFDVKRTPEFTTQNCVRALVGEYARNDSYGMRLMAHAIRNRGTLKGIYGFNAKHIEREPKEIWVTAALEWIESIHDSDDPVRGANEWRSFQDIAKKGMPNLKLIKIYDGVYFFKNPALKVRNPRRIE